MLQSRSLLKKLSSRALRFQSFKSTTNVVSAKFSTYQKQGGFGLTNSLSSASSNKPFSSSMFQPSRFFASHTEVVPSLGDSISEGEVGDIVKAVGDFIDVDEIFLTIETDKVGTELRAAKAGKITEFKVEEGDTVEVGSELIVVDTDAVNEAGGAPAAPAATTAEPVAAAAASTAAPVVAAAAAPKKAAPPPPPPQAVSVHGARTEYTKPITRMRLAISRNMKEAQNTAALLTTFQEVDMSALMDMRKKYKDEFLADRGVKLGFMSAFVKASTAALIKYPDVNALFDIDNKVTVYRDYVDISVAVATPTGLVTPVLRNCENMDFAAVESSISALGQKARAGRMAMEDMQGGTFTISNGGVYGSLMGTPIVNPPQSAVLGMHGIFDRPIAVNGQVVIRPMMYVALTYDHRIIDGATGVQFLKHIKQCIEDPNRLVLGV